MKKNDLEERIDILEDIVGRMLCFGIYMEGISQLGDEHWLWTKYKPEWFNKALKEAKSNYPENFISTKKQKKGKSLFDRIARI